MSKRTKGETCEEVLLKHLRYVPEGIWTRKVDLYPIAEDWSPETVGRALRALTENGQIFVSYYDGRIAKNLAMYSIAPEVKVKKVIYKVIEEDGVRKAIPIYE